MLFSNNFPSQLHNPVQRKERKEKGKKKEKEATTQVPDFASDDFRLSFPTCACCTLTADDNKHKLLYRTENNIHFQHDFP